MLQLLLILLLLLQPLLDETLCAVCVSTAKPVSDDKRGGCRALNSRSDHLLCGHV